MAKLLRTNLIKSESVWIRFFRFGRIQFAFGYCGDLSQEYFASLDITGKPMYDSAGKFYQKHIAHIFL